MSYWVHVLHEPKAFEAALRLSSDNWESEDWLLYESYINTLDEPTYSVYFVKSKDGTITAIFPNTIADNKGNCMCYAHIGQHSACSEEWIEEQEIALVSEWEELGNELVSIDYKLDIPIKYIKLIR